MGALAVCEEGRIIGVVTDREMTTHIAAVGRDPATTLVKDIMNSDPAVVSQDETVMAAEQAMEAKGSHRVFAGDRDRRLVGIVSLVKIAMADSLLAAGK